MRLTPLPDKFCRSVIVPKPVILWYLPNITSAITSQKSSSSTLMNCKSACNREIPKATQSTGPNSCQTLRSITQHYERQGLQKPLERGNFYMNSTELGMTFQLLHLPVYVKRITLITFGFCFVSLQLCSVLCSRLLLVGRLMLYRSLISLSPIQQGSEKSFFESWTAKSKIINLRSVSKVEMKKVHCYASYNDKKTH